MMIRVAVIDDHPLFRDGVTQTLQSAGDIEVVGQGSCVADAIRISRDLHPDVVVLDMNLADGGDGISAVEGIVACAPSVRVLVLTVVADDARIREAIHKGAHGYVLKGIGGAELMSALRAVHHGDGYVTPTLAACLFPRLDGRAGSAGPPIASAVRLSTREDQILSHIARGLSNKEIGLLLELSEKTVKHYVTNLLQKMHVRNRTQAALCAFQMRADRDAAMATERAEARAVPYPSANHTRPI